MLTSIDRPLLSQTHTRSTIREKIRHHTHIRLSLQVRRSRLVDLHTSQHAVYCDPDLAGLSTNRRSANQGRDFMQFRQTSVKLISC
jgi:hypothetical protein